MTWIDRNRSGFLLGIPLVIGFVLIMLSPWGPVSRHSIPWDNMVLTVGAVMMAASLSAFIAGRKRCDRLVPLIALLALTAIFALLLWFSDWNPRLVALTGVPAGVLATEVLMCLLKRRFP